QENSQEQHNIHLIVSNITSLKILYNTDYSHDDFPAKFENEEVRKVCCKKHAVKGSNSNELIEIKENPDNYIKPLDIMEKNTQQMITCYRPNITFKEPESVIKHIAECVANNAKYFEIFGEFKVKREDNKEANNCECLANRCVLGLGFSELADHKKQLAERVFENIREEIEKNGSQLDNLNEQKGRVNDKINEIKVQIEIKQKYLLNSSLDPLGRYVNAEEAKQKNYNSYEDYYYDCLPDVEFDDDDILTAKDYQEIYKEMIDKIKQGDKFDVNGYKSSEIKEVIFSEVDLTNNSKEIPKIEKIFILVLPKSCKKSEKKKDTKSQDIENFAEPQWVKEKIATQELDLDELRKSFSNSNEKSTDESLFSNKENNTLEQVINHFPEKVSQFKILELTQFMFAKETSVTKDVEASISFPTLLSELTGFKDTLPGNPNHGYIKPLVRNLLQQLHQNNNPDLDKYLVLRDEIKQPNT
ncbi:27682_t:CDS:2, partial [Gigaspora margarita]